MRRKAEVDGNDLEEMIKNIEKRGGNASEIRRLREEMKPKPKVGKAPKLDKVEPEPEPINWTPQHEAFQQKIQFLIETQGLEIHPKLRPRLRAWIDAAINRDYKCVMGKVRECPCEEPTKWGCPLLRLPQ